MLAAMRLLLDRHARHLLALCDHRSVQGAAAALGLTQPALSKSLRRMEDEIGAPLFERTASGLAPTEAGLRLAHHARLMADAARQAEIDLSALTGGDGGTLRLGVGLAWSLSRAPRALAEMSARFPRLGLEVTAGVGARVLPLLATRAIDVYGGVLHPELVPPGCEVERRRDLALRAFARAGHPLAERRDPAGLGDHPWALFSDDAAGRLLVTRALERLGAAAPTFTLASDSLATLLDTVGRTDHILPLVEVLTPKAASRGVAPLEGVPALATLPSAVVSRAGLGALRPVRALLDLLVE